MYRSFIPSIDNTQRSNDLFYQWITIFSLTRLLLIKNDQPQINFRDCQVDLIHVEVTENRWYNIILIALKTITWIILIVHEYLIYLIIILLWKMNKYLLCNCSKHNIIIYKRIILITILLLINYNNLNINAQSR